MIKTHQPHPAISRRPLPLQAKDQSTICVLCSHGCGIRVDIEDGAIKKIRPDESNPITEGYSCNKAFSVHHYARHAQRVTEPMERQTDGSYKPITWEAAISRIGRRLKAIVDEHGGRSFAVVGVGGQANHMEAPYALGLLTGLGSLRWFSAYAQEKTQNQLVDRWMMQASPAVFLHSDIDHTNYLLVMGTNPRISNRGHSANETFRAVVQDPDRRLVVVDPRETETTRGADAHLRVRPGQDCYLMLGMAAEIVQQNLCDDRFLNQRTRDAEPLLRVLRDLDVAAMAQRAGVDETELRGEARRFAEAKSACILWDLGIEQGRFSTLNAYLIRVLLVLTGNLGNEGGMAFLEAFNPPGSGKSRRAPEKAVVSGIEGIRALGNYPMFSPSLFPEEVLNDHPERIRATIVTGSNPLLSYSGTPKWREAFEALELSVVIEPAMTETARLADFVLPTPVGYEKWEYAGFPRPGFPSIHHQVRPPVLPAPGSALPEPEIFVRLAEAMNLFGSPPRALELLAMTAHRPEGRAAFSAAILPLASRAAKRAGNGSQNRVLFWSYRLLGPHMDAPSLSSLWFMCLQNAIARRDAVLRVLGPTFKRRTPFALAGELFDRLLTHPEGALMAEVSMDQHLSKNIGFDDGLIRLALPQMLSELARALAAPDKTTEEFPLVLAAGLRTRWTANTIHREHGWRKGRGPHCPLQLSKEDADALGLGKGDRARLVTSEGSAELPIDIDARLPRGMVSVPNGFGIVNNDGVADGLNLNELTATSDRDPFTGCPEHKHVPCRVEVVA